VIETMTDTLLHRGPDGRGFRHGPGYALGHRRLSIIDLEGGRQPLGNDAADVWTVVNGEIYNFQSLRDELRAAGHHFKTGSDSEVVLHGHRHWGKAAITRLDGMFAYAHVDEATRRLILARDRLGIKPLYYAQFDGALLFASEPKALLAYPGFPKRLNKAAVGSYLDYRYVVGEQTFFEGIRQLPAGHQLIVEDGNVRIERYWEIPADAETLDLDDSTAIAHVTESLARAVEARLVSDVPFGAYLSGGLDSSLVVALMARRHSSPIKTYSTGFEEDGYNEFPFARMVADAYGTQHKEILLTQDRYFELLPQLIRYKDAPLGVPNEVPLWQMSEVLKQDITVVLSGEGADELFGGYGRIFRAAAQLDDSGFQGDVASEFLARYGYFGEAALRQYLAPDLLADTASLGYGAQTLRSAFDQVRHLSAVRQFLWVFQKHHLPGLLQRLDTTTMAAAVEGRVPFVDHHLVELGHRLPPSLKLRWKSEADRVAAAGLKPDKISEIYDTPKWILRQVGLSLLPEAVVTRKKVGFPVPLGKWLGGKLKDTAREVLLTDRCRQRGLFDVSAIESALSSMGESQWDVGMRVWMLLCLETFCAEYFD
jgi:asparagine synthase (glutamine-hydrolysing)